MYLFVFIFLLLSIAGLYTELYMLQVSQMLSKQKAIAETMLTWHGGAMAFAKKNFTGTDTTFLYNVAAGCLITGPAVQTLGSSSMAGCPSRLNVTNDDFLPQEYSTDFKWYSVAYTRSTGRVVLTFAPPSTAGNVSSAISFPEIGYSPADIWRQIKLIGAPKTAYGMVQNVSGVGSRFVTPDAPGGSQVYLLPGCGTGCVPLGSVGFISPF